MGCHIHTLVGRFVKRMHSLFDPWSQPAAAPTHLFSDEAPTKLAAKYYTKRPPPRLAAPPSRRHSTASPCPLDPPPPPHPLGLLADHPNPVVAQFPYTGFSHLADRPLLARAIHVLALRRTLPLGTFHRSTLLAFYFRHRSPAAALHLFDAMPDRTPSSWYTAVSCCVRCGRDAEAFDLLRGIRGHEVPLSGFALASLVTSCKRWGEEGRACGPAIHALAHKSGLMGNVYIGTALLHLYGSRGLVLDHAEARAECGVVDGIDGGVVVKRVPGRSVGSLPPDEEGRGRVMCNANKFATVAGLQVASHVMVSGLQRQVSVANSLITMFGNLGRVQDAEKLLSIS